MTGIQMMDYYVWPRHINSHSRTCTCSGLCRRPSSLVAFHIFYLLNRASIHEISALVILILVIPVYIRYLHLLWRSWYIVYCTWRWPHDTLYIMHIHGHCTLMYPGLLYVFVVTCKDWLLYCTDEWLVLQYGSSLLHLWDGFYNVFRPSYYPFDVTL